ncbi:hypothetical protein PoB_002188800 [Plakobranchus ocellatus]|uniref:Uncharacterized protein n=1 Tax=Plakobranchus ocellatus TaxID=259542 RepID=A0AAV3ZLA4_9GAST|nr:hypothetical protein PoB_002188800 [Plakobranchus ocellatus]
MFQSPGNHLKSLLLCGEVSTSVWSAQYKDVYLVMILPEAAVNKTCYNDDCPLGIGLSPPTPVRGVNWNVRSMSISTEQEHIVYLQNDSATTFGLYVFRLDNGKGDFTAVGMRFLTQRCHTTIMQVGDGVDNDCDENIDEETWNGKVILHTKENKYIMFLSRLCDSPKPTGQGRYCPGEEAEISSEICDLSQTLCPEECPPKKWGPTCANNCPIGCVNEACSHVTGYCFMCVPGRMGLQCAFDLLTLPFILLCIGLALVPSVFIFAMIFWCRSRDPERVKLRKTIKSIDYQIMRMKFINQRVGDELKGCTRKPDRTTSPTKRT